MMLMQEASQIILRRSDLGAQSGKECSLQIPRFSIPALNAMVPRGREEEVVVNRPHLIEGIAMTDLCDENKPQ